jgi:hypothetical protein
MIFSFVICLMALPRFLSFVEALSTNLSAH